MRTGLITQPLKKLIGIMLGIIIAKISMSADMLNVPEGIMQLDGRNAPPLQLENMDNQKFDLRNSKGHWVLVHFWATWCGPCRKEMPTIQTMSEQIDKNKLEIVLINTAESDDRVFSFLGIVAPDFNPLMDRDGLVTERWQPRGLPASFFVDPDGKLRYLALGGRKWDSPTFLKFVNNLP